MSANQLNTIVIYEKGINTSSENLRLSMYLFDFCRNQAKYIKGYFITLFSSQFRFDDFFLLFYDS